MCLPLVVCSGLDGTCYSNNTVIAIGINFKSINNICHTIYLTVRVKQSSLIDLIIGRVSLNKCSFYKLTPFAFGISEEHKVTSSVSVDCSTCDDLPDVEPLLSQRFTTILSSDRMNKVLIKNAKNISIEEQSVVTQLSHSSNILRDIGQPTTEGEKLTICGHSCCSSGTGSCPALLELATPEAGCDRGRAVHGSIVHPELTRDGDTPPEDGLDSIPPTPGFLNDEKHDTLGHSPSVVIISYDEIDSEKTDNFGPFLQGTSPDLPPDSNGSDKFLDEITFVGTGDQINAVKLLCLEFRDLFSNKIATLSAKLDPFRLDVREQEWEISANRTPVRPQSSRKEIDIKKSLRRDAFIRYHRTFECSLLQSPCSSTKDS